MARSMTTDRTRTFTLAVPVDGGTVDVTVTRKRVKNLNLRVHGDGSVTLSVPWRTSRARAQEFLERRADWIARHRTRKRTAPPAPLAPDGTPGVVLWGEVVPAARALAQAGIATGDLAPEALAAHTAELYRRACARALPAVVERVERRMGVHAAGWQVRTMRSRWGSCTPARATVRINARLAAYPPACLEFVVAHELTHLMEPSHNARFHMLLDTYCPANREAAALLRRLPEDVAREHAVC